MEFTEWYLAIVRLLYVLMRMIMDTSGSFFVQLQILKRCDPCF